jgi:hypothetical protein
MSMWHRLAALAPLVCACDEEKADPAPAPAAAPVYGPKMTEELVPPGAKGLVLGVATEKDVTAAFPAAKIVKDQRLGGRAKAEYGGQPAVRLDLAASDDLVQGAAWLRSEADGEPKLVVLQLALKTKDTCKWIEEHVGVHEGSKGRGGFAFAPRRAYGPGEYTAGSADGSLPAEIFCHPSERDGTPVEQLEYRLDLGDNMWFVNENP